MFIFPLLSFVSFSSIVLAAAAGRSQQQTPIHVVTMEVSTPSVCARIDCVLQSLTPQKSVAEEAESESGIYKTVEFRMYCFKVSRVLCTSCV